MFFMLVGEGFDFVPPLLLIPTKMDTEIKYEKVYVNTSEEYDPDWIVEEAKNAHFEVARDNLGKLMPYVIILNVNGGECNEYDFFSIKEQSKLQLEVLVFK